ncbi:MAG: dTDP-4-dehydrorhamnose 3,5-epimerase [Elusimicrobiales bacterium]
MPFEFEKTHLDGVLVIKPKTFFDNRGFFREVFKSSDFKKKVGDVVFVQDNFSYSVKNVIRGLHFQKKPKEQAKIVMCIYGEIFDVAVDLRNESPNYLRWFGIRLSSNNGFMLYIPKGFAHGFAVLSESACVYYKCDEEYSFEHDSGVRYDDPDIGVKWGVENPILSDKDLKLPYIKDLK